MSKLLKFFSIIAVFSLLQGCGYFAERFKNIGKRPELNVVDTAAQNQQINALTKAHLTSNHLSRDGALENRGRNSLWKPGSRTFFRDQRARSVGDILKVKIMIQDQAQLDNKTEKKRDSSNKAGISSLFGLERVLRKDTAINPEKMIGVGGSGNEAGSGKIDRKENVSTTVAATVIRILPSNNLLIKGAQEIRVNNELREITVEGIVRPEDISSDNSVTIDQIAEARISYGGRGHLTDYQQGRYGSQVLDILAPF